MPTTLMARTLAKLKARDKPYYVTDALVPGLQIRVGASGDKSWSLRYRIDKRMRRLTLGSMKTLSLADAREMARGNLKQVAKGVDPAKAKQERRTAPTVGEFAKTFVEQHAKKKQKRWKDVESRLNNDILPAWKHKVMRDITRRDVRELVEGIAARPAPISANRVRALLHKFFAVAIQYDIVESNPVDGVPLPGVERRRDRVLTHDEIRQFWSKCDLLPAEMAAAFRLRLVTAQRGSEVGNMTWSEVDLTTGWWTIPAERSKNGMSHRVPLSAMALEMLNGLRAAADERQKTQKRTRKGLPKPLEKQPPSFVLQNARGKRQQAEAAATFKIKDFHGHDLRRTAASLMTGSGTPRLVVSKILNHAEPGVTSVYDRQSSDAEKRVALDAWARTLTGIIEDRESAHVVAFARS